MFKTIQKNKIFFSLIIEITSARCVNEIIKKEIIENHEIKECAMFFKKDKLLQCLNCYGYEHFVKNCKKKSKCGHCAEDHRIDFCKSTTNKCAACELGYKVWFNACKYKQEEKNKKRAMIVSRSVFYTKEKKCVKSVENARGRKRDRNEQGVGSAIFFKFFPVSKEKQDGISKRISNEWQTAFSGRTNGLFIKRIYIKTKISNKTTTTIIDDEELWKTIILKFCNTTFAIKKTQLWFFCWRTQKSKISMF